MADIRIKDLATTATTTASDDFMAVDGAINGTRKLSAAAPAFLTSVTTPTLTAPAATNLTLAGGTAGSDSVVVSNTLAASSAIIGAFKVGNGTAATNVAIGGGKVNIGDTTAGASGAGALVVAGGIGVAGAAYFGAGVAVGGSPALATGYGGTILLSSGESGAISRLYMGDGSGWSFRIASRSGSVTTDRFTFADNGTLTVSGTTSASSSVTGTLVVGNLTPATTVAIGGGNINAGGTGTFAGAVTSTSGIFAVPDGGVLYFTNGSDTYIQGNDASTFIRAVVAGTNRLEANASGVTITGALKLGNAYVGTPVVSTGYITIQDNTGTTYKVAVSL